jgi:hypothetical protein
MMRTEEFYRYAVAGYEALAERVFDDGKLYAKFEYTCWGDNNEEYVYIPLEYLWTENFVEIEKVRYAAERAEAIRLAEEQKRLEDAEVKRKAAIKERQTYERLKKKFEEMKTEGDND